MTLPYANDLVSTVWLYLHRLHWKNADLPCLLVILLLGLSLYVSHLCFRWMTDPLQHSQHPKPQQSFTGPIRSSRPSNRSENTYSRPTPARPTSEPLPPRHASRNSVDSSALSTERGVLAFLTKFDDEENTGCGFISRPHRASLIEVVLRYLAAKFDKICQRPRGASLEAADMSSIERSLASRNLDTAVVKKVMSHMKNLLEGYTTEGGSGWAEFVCSSPLSSIKLMFS